MDDWIRAQTGRRPEAPKAPAPYTEQQIQDVARVMGMTRDQALNWLMTPAEPRTSAPGHAGVGTQQQPKKTASMSDFIRRMAGR